MGNCEISTTRAPLKSPSNIFKHWFLQKIIHLQKSSYICTFILMWSLTKHFCFFRHILKISYRIIEGFKGVPILARDVILSDRRCNFFQIFLINSVSKITFLSCLIVWKLLDRNFFLLPLTHPTPEIEPDGRIELCD